MILFMALFAMSARCQESSVVDHVTTEADSGRQKHAGYALCGRDS